ncbi:MAG: tetratricopeptide repeat protein [Pseudobdellovibrionaceae bacterium]
MRSYADLIQSCDQNIREGQADIAKSQLKGLNTNHVPPAQRLPLARLCRRTGLYSVGLKLLTKSVLLHEDATPHEMAEYAVLLLRSGAVSEAIARLKMVDAREVPQAFLYRSFGHFLIWEFAAAAKELEQYLRTPLSPIDRLIGSVNLAMAMVELRRSKEASERLAEAIELAKALSHIQLESTCRSLWAQLHMQNGDFANAKIELQTARSLTSQTFTNDNFLTTKCEMLIDGLESKQVAPLIRLKEYAIKNKFWEASREAEMYALKLKFDPDLYLQLVCGTPFAGFRNLVREELGPHSHSLDYTFGDKTVSPLNLHTGTLDGKQLLNPGKLTHRMLEVLLRDFYQPPRVTALFSELFPGEYFNITSSPLRVRQALKRTRTWLRANQIPVSIEESRGFYFLKILGPFAFQIPIDRRPVEPLIQQIDTLSNSFGEGQIFLAKEAQSVLNVPKWQVIRILRAGIEKGKIERIGESQRTTKYKIA